MTDEPSVLSVITGSGRQTDRTEEVVAAIIAAIYDTADGMTLAAVIGCLEFAKMAVIDEARE